VATGNKPRGQDPSVMEAVAPTPTRPLLEVEDLVKDFGGLRAIDHCSLAVQQGTITGLIGPNGAGKTTLFNVITGFYQPDSGHVTLDGQDVTGLPPHELFHRKLCRTFQIPREHPTMTVLENLMLPAEGQAGERFWNCWFRPSLVRRQERDIYHHAMEVLEFVKLTHLKDEYAGRLSGGQKKLLELARTLMVEPRIVLLDEPAAGINRTLLKTLSQTIRYLCDQRGITFLLIEHDMDLVMRFCNPVIVMTEGHQLMTGTPDEVRHDPRVLDAYLGGQYAAA
ncbi:MAG: ABC transporter ATP-binding protein, partial [Acetobacteraceae bacterium]